MDMYCVYLLLYFIYLLYGAMSIEHNMDMDTRADDRSEGWSFESVAETKALLDEHRQELTNLRSDIEQQRLTEAEQYYMLWKATVERGDINKVKNALSTQENIQSAHISMLGGADQLFMSEEGWQRILDAEITKFQWLKNSFSGDNKAMIDRLIAELSDNTKHINLAKRFVRSDERSNLGNAKLIAARMASWYHEVLTTMIQQEVDVVFSYTVDWDRCVIGASGNNLSDRKIQVNVSLDFLAWEDAGIDSELSDNEYGAFTPIAEPGDTDSGYSEPVVIEEVVDQVVDPKEEGVSVDIDPELSEVISTEKEPEDNKSKEIEGPKDEEYEGDVVEQEQSIDIMSVDDIKREIHIIFENRPFIFWQGDGPGKYQFDHTNREELGWWYEAIRVRDHEGNVVLDIGINPDGIPYIWLDSYEYRIAPNSRQESLDVYIGYLSYILGLTSDKFDKLLIAIKQWFENEYRQQDDSDDTVSDRVDKYAEQNVESIEFNIPYTVTWTNSHKQAAHHIAMTNMLRSISTSLGKSVPQSWVDYRVVEQYEDFDSSEGRWVCTIVYEMLSPKANIPAAKGVAEIPVSEVESSLQEDVSHVPVQDQVIAKEEDQKKFEEGTKNDITGNTSIDEQKAEEARIAKERGEANKKIDPEIADLYADLGEENLQKLWVTLSKMPDINLADALRNGNTMDIVKSLLSIDDSHLKKEVMGILLSHELQNRMVGITMDQLVSALVQVPDVPLQEQVVANLLIGETASAMHLIGMKKWSSYPKNAIGQPPNLNQAFLKNLAERRNRVFHSWFDIFSWKQLFNEFGQRGTMPADVKNAYMMFVSDSIRWQIKDTLPSQNIPSRKIQSQGNYAIISKTDGHMYLFDADHRLVSRKSVLLGRDRSDASFRVHDYPIKNDAWQTVNFAPPKRTPRGLYSIEARWPKDKIGRYMQFFPKDSQIDYGPLNKNGDRKWTIGIHELYSNEYAKRDGAIRSSNVYDKFLSNGCINMHNNYYAEVWDHLGIGSSVYVS